MTRFLPVRFIWAASLAACGGGRADVVERSGEPDVYNVASDDPAMESAVAAARGTVVAFAARVRSPASGQSYAGVKVPLRDAGRVEHVWMSDLRYDGRSFHGRLGNAPVDLPRWRAGDPASVARDSVSDWMLVARDTVFGAYSVHLLRGRMAADERAAFDREQGVVFPVDPRPAP